MSKLDIVANNYAKDDLVCFNDSILALYKDCYIQGFKRGVEVGKVQKTGEWIKLNEEMNLKYALFKCSFCGKTLRMHINGRKYEYCPKCGAKMQNNEK